MLHFECTRGIGALYGNKFVPVAKSILRKNTVSLNKIDIKFFGVNLMTKTIRKVICSLSDVYRGEYFPFLIK